MKLKVRGLVFTGFAAAVFASSAMAVAPVTPASLQNSATQATLKKTVTSQYHTDETYQGRVNGTEALTVTGSGENTVVEDAALVGWQYGAAGENKEWVKLTGNDYTVIKNEKGAHTVEIRGDRVALHGVDDPTTQADENEIVDGSTKLVTAQAVYEYVHENVLDDQYQPKATSSDGAQVGVRLVEGEGANQTETSTWYGLKAGQNGAAVSTMPYAQIARTDTAGSTQGVYIDLNHANIIGTDVSGDATQSNYYTGGITANAGNRLATGGAVYNYAQPRASTLAKAQIGYKADNATDSTWNTIQASGATETTGATENYVTMPRDSSTSTYNINLASAKITTSGAQVIAAEGNGSGENGDLSDLPTVNAVKEYVQSVTNGNTLPAMPSACNNANVHCALVSVHYATATTDPLDQTQTIPAGTTRLEWTVMAQAQ